MEFQTALTLEIGRLNQSVITSYRLGILMFRLYRAKKYKGEKLTRLTKNVPDRSDYQRHIKELVRRAILLENAALKNPEVYSIFGRAEANPKEVACAIDPFAYISHMSAMEWHGLTDRVPKLLFLSSPAPKEWRRFAVDKMHKDLPSEDLILYSSKGLPQLRRLALEKIGNTIVSRYSSVHLGAFTTVRDKALRVSTIGRTFLDMMREPDLCGGIYHVLQIFEEQAERYLQLIVDEIERYGTKVDKVRAGYILEERGGLTHPIIENWTQHAQRGGSRKLSSQSEYSPRFSEKWCLSLNIEE